MKKPKKAGADAPTPPTVREPDVVLTERQRRLVEENWPPFMSALAALGADSAGHDRVRFRGREYLLIGNTQDGGAIAPSSNTRPVKSRSHT